MAQQEEQMLPPGINEKVLQEVYRMLKQRPCSVLDIAEELEKAVRTIRNYIVYLDSIKMIEKIPYSNGHFQLANHKYEIDLSGPIENIPHINFRDIPRIKQMFNYALGSQEKLKNVGCFERFCYGQIVKKFKINPEHWEHPKDTERLYLLYKEQYRTEYPPQYVKAIRQFLSFCMRITITKGSIEAKLCGLVQSHDPGKYRHIRFNDDDELNRAIDWLEGKECEQLCEQLKVSKKSALAAFAFALEGFPRPSRLLTIEVAKVEKHPNLKGDLSKGVHLEWTQLETKQGVYYPKRMDNPRLVSHAVEWLEKRRTLGYRFLFLDNSDYAPYSGDSGHLADDREPYAAVYKALFKHLDKQEKIWYNRPSYMLRHCGVNLWLQRLGVFRGITLLRTMGWESETVLRSYYAHITPADIAKEIGQALYSQQ